METLRTHVITSDNSFNQGPLPKENQTFRPPPLKPNEHDNLHGTDGGCLLGIGWMGICMYVCMYAFKRIYVFLYVYVFVFMYVFMCLNCYKSWKTRRSGDRLLTGQGASLHTGGWCSEGYSTRNCKPKLSAPEKKVWLAWPNPKSAADAPKIWWWPKVWHPPTTHMGCPDTIQHSKWSNKPHSRWHLCLESEGFALGAGTFLRLWPELFWRKSALTIPWKGCNFNLFSR